MEDKGGVPAEAVDTRTNRRLQLYGREYEYVSEIIQVIQGDVDTIPGKITLWDRYGFSIPPELSVSEVNWGQTVMFSVHMSLEDRRKLYFLVQDEITSHFLEDDDYATWCRFLKDGKEPPASVVSKILGLEFAFCCADWKKHGYVACLKDGQIQLERRYNPVDLWNYMFGIQTYEEGLVVYVKNRDDLVLKWRQKLPLFWKGIPLRVAPEPR